MTAEIEGLTKTLARLRADNSKSQRGLPEAERMHSMKEQERSIERREMQIETWLETQGVPLPRHATTAAAGDHEHPPVDAMVARALEYVQAQGQRSWKPARVFRRGRGRDHGRCASHREGRGCRGRWRHLHRGDGRRWLAAHVASRALEVGTYVLREVGAVLFDPDNIRPPEIVTGWQKWLGDGNVVMWAIATLGLMAALLFVERLLMFMVFGIRVLRAERRGLGEAVSEDDPILAPVAVVQRSQGSADEIEERAVEAVLQAQPVVRRGVSLLGVVAAVTPLLGLLGTVSGMIATFAVINDHGTGDPKLLSGGISEALLSTQFGLVAIPALLMQTALYRGGDAIRRVVALKGLATHTGEAKEEASSVTSGEGGAS